MPDLILPITGTVLLFLMLWPISVIRRDASLVDLLWGPGFGVLAIATLASSESPAGTRDLLLTGLIVVWAARLGWQMGARRLREAHEDPRYAEIRAAWDPGFWWKSLFIVFLLQALLQSLIAVGPLLAMGTQDQAIGPAGWVSVAVAVAGLLLESKADVELDRHKRREGAGTLCVSGLRAYLRHPNYLGEIVFWVGIAGLCLEGGVVTGAAAPVLISVVIVRVSGIPMLDERLAKTRPDYPHYKARVPALFPRRSPYIKPQ